MLSNKFFISFKFYVNYFVLLYIKKDISIVHAIYKAGIGCFAENIFAYFYLKNVFSCRYKDIILCKFASYIISTETYIIHTFNVNNYHMGSQ